MLVGNDKLVIELLIPMHVGANMYLVELVEVRPNMIWSFTIPKKIERVVLITYSSFDCYIPLVLISYLVNLSL